MAKIKEQGTPTKSTVGAIGDIYIDTLTGDKYRCTFAFCDSRFDDGEYDWELVHKAEAKKPYQKPYRN
jgi:hypothetical protein